MRYLMLREAWFVDAPTKESDESEEELAILIIVILIMIINFRSDKLN
jgi:hypothetical protein